MLEHLTPVIAALGCCAMVVLVSNSMDDGKKFYFQASFFAAALAASFSYLVANKDALERFLAAFAALSQELRLVLSLFVITVTYFGGALYVGVVSPAPRESMSLFPASSDNNLDFEVPANMSKDDTKMFEDVFKK